MRRAATIAALLAVCAAVLFAAGCGAGTQATATPESCTPSCPKPGATGPDLPALKLTGVAAAGKTVFASAGCVGCHTLADAGATGTVGPNLDSAKPARELVVQRVTLGQGAMPAFSKAKGGSLADQQIADVAAYVVQATGG
jgi:mono/diheme cytochrome c family protein